MNRYELMVFVEEGVKNGGFGEYAAELAVRRGCGARLLVLAVREQYVSLGTRDELLRENGLDGPGIARAVSLIWDEFRPKAAHAAAGLVP